METLFQDDCINGKVLKRLIKSREGTNPAALYSFDRITLDSKRGHFFS